MTDIIPPGTLVDRYLIGSLLGRGGMGEVYEARDTKIGRRVAIKVITSKLALDPEKIQRFETEAQAAGAMNHPNLLIVYDVGTYLGVPYLVTELLVGDNLRERLTAGKPPTALTIDFAIQIARGLAAAHDSGIVHRDLKPENLFITKQDNVKILDFGLAKLLPHENASSVDTISAANTTPARRLAGRAQTSPGVIVGTAGYMSPEQVRGEGTVDHRSDIFSFGSVFYEMLTGKRAFLGESTVETMNAILKEDPFEAEDSPPLDPSLERVVRHCLEKKPELRFQSTRDLAFDLENLTGVMRSSSSTRLPAPIEKKRTWLVPAVAAALVLAAIAVIYLIVAKMGGPAHSLSYRQLTFRQGTVSSARFAVDGQTVFFNAAWNGRETTIFSTRTENPESHSVGLVNADLLAISANGEMAVLLNRQYVSHFVNRGTLARMPLFGGSPREILEDVQQADWSPDGSNLAVVHHVSGQNQLEFPIGNVLYRTPGYISYPRVSPAGDKIAFLDHPTLRDNRGSVAFVDLKGNKTVLSPEWADAQGLAWSADGAEIWFTASQTGESLSLYAINLSGKQRKLLGIPNGLIIHDISRNGRVLATSFTESTAIFGLPPGEEKERDLSWVDRSGLYDLSSDGKEFVFQYYGEGSGTNYASYLQRTDGSPAVRLGAGAAVSLSPDSKWVLAVLNNPKQLTLLPTGPGDARSFDLKGVEDYGNYSWFPDGKRLLFAGRRTGGELGSYALDLDTGETSLVVGGGVTGNFISPDGQFFVAMNAEKKRVLYPLHGGEPQTIAGLDDDEEIIRWASDAHSLFVYKRGQFPIRVYKINVETQHRVLWKEILGSDTAGVVGQPRIFLSADGQSYVYQLHRHLSGLYMVENLGR